VASSSIKVAEGCETTGDHQGERGEVTTGGGGESQSVIGYSIMDGFRIRSQAKPRPWGAILGKGPDIMANVRER